MSELPHPENAAQLWATVWFVIGLTHTFLVSRFQAIGNRMPEGSVGENFFHLMGEVEVVFGFYAGIFLGAFALHSGKDVMLQYLDSVQFTEPAFVFAIMVVAATRPVLHAADGLIQGVARFISRGLRVSSGAAFYAAALIVGPLLGSLITEPAAMTVTALLLKRGFYDRGISPRLMYATLGLLFVNISIGGTLTSFAAPPVLMVAAKWNWDFHFMMTHFGFRTIAAICVSTLVTTFYFRRELSSLSQKPAELSNHIPAWVIVIHLILLAMIVLNSHHMIVFMGVLLFFLGVVEVLKEYNDSLRLKEALMVAFFLGGLVVLGNQQRWWLEWLLARLDPTALFWGATGLTAVTDNAALTYLGSQVSNLGQSAKIALVAGAVTGGGLTVIANAPNPAGYGILNSSFGKGGINPLRLLAAALFPTFVTAIVFI